MNNMTAKTFLRDFYRDLTDLEQRVWDTADQFATEQLLEEFGEDPTIEDVKYVLHTYID